MAIPLKSSVLDPGVSPKLHYLPHPYVVSVKVHTWHEGVESDDGKTWEQSYLDTLQAEVNKMVRSSGNV